MSERPTWMILIPTVPARTASFQLLVHRLLPQLDYWQGHVQVCGWLNVGEPRLAEIRDALLEHAERSGAEYVSFIDDDDMVPEYYVGVIMEELRKVNFSVDHVGFQLEYWKDGEFRSIVEHSLKHKKWGHTVVRENGARRLELYRHFTHVDPIRTELARRGRFARAGLHQPEDRNWVRQVTPHVRTEVFVPRVMYQYFWTPAASAWDGPEKIERLYSEEARNALAYSRTVGQEMNPWERDFLVRQLTRRPAIESEHFHWHPSSL